MKILLIHADYIEFEPREKAAEVFDPATPGEKKRVDSAAMDTIVDQCVAYILEAARQVCAEKVCLYPYAHLSNTLAPPDIAIEIMHRIENTLRGEMDVVSAPFGWYKSFKLSCKGHPLSELSREIRPEKISVRRVKGENTYLILTPEGKEIEPSQYPLKKDGFSILVEKEALKIGRKLVSEPRYLRLCRKFGLEWEPMSDTGHMRYGPKGALMFDLAAAYALQVVLGMPCPVYPVRGTNMFNLNESAVREHAELFGDRLYTIKSDEKEFVLRYAACHQQFAMIRNWVLSYRNIPFGAFEVADSYRVEQSGECMLGFRVRRLNMPDLHIFCRNEEDAKRWFEVVHDRIFHEIEKLGRDYELLMNISSRRYYEEYRDWIISMLKKRNKNALICIYPEGKNYYWTINVEYNIIDIEGHEREIATDQIDIGNAKRFGICYTDEKGEKRYPVIIHTAIIGTIERFLFALFDTALKDELEGRKGCLPLWINPEQVRLLPVTDRHIPLAYRYAEKLKGAGARVGIDDRQESIARKVRDAKQDWVGYVIVLGDREETSSTINVYDRMSDTNREMTIDQLCKEFRERVAGYPGAPLYFAPELSKRPGF
jgi:threonyl-tRNA synthetase